MASIAVTKRTMLGKNACQKVRNEEQIPAVVYGLKKDAIPLICSKENLLPILHEKIVKLAIDDVQEDVMIKEVQYDTFGEHVLHVDFLRIDLTKKISLSVPLKFVGVPKGVQMGGFWEKQIKDILISCLPIDIPSVIPVPVEHLEIGGTIRMKDISMPSTATLEMDPELLVTAVHAAKETLEAPAGTGEDRAEPELIKKAKEKQEEE